LRCDVLVVVVAAAVACKDKTTEFCQIILFVKMKM
jgi:hypothetical protein